ncbi:sodium-dependent transporter [Helicobacter cappadocius]|uniref:Transporter n=1 Tax=Helicobacter cappadocius TaxID=3063998 RepID=A0AA90Q382_9HELI|nr:MULTISPECIES: sodium-dependent transporter [unclassified Helicobacter]MDO7253413.1 sodium-dependent transporter [Helicobacter sp. faydin-H75]MDP2539323.1 sodium-dependent transporter [Helicobacter sp. faydin-H76]
MQKRQLWSSRLTYVLTVAGATVGFGATWRFPYLVGENGGGAYVLVFIIAMIVVGIPIILVENIIGRRAHMNSVDAFGGVTQGRKISKYWKIFGYMGLIGAFGILAYYMVLGGWVISYIVSILSGGLDLSSAITKNIASDFYDIHIEHSPLMVGIFTFIFVVLNWVILSKGIIDGIERSMKYLMPLLFLCLLAMVVRNLTMPGAIEGVKFYLTPDFSKITPKLFILVLGQVFFALSLGFGVMITLSSYLHKEEDMVKTAIITGILNTFIAIMAGFMIFPSLFSFGLSPDSGPSLVFKTLPIVFSHMPFGNLFAVVFFLLLITAALTTSLPIYEVIITTLTEKLKLNRKKAISITLSFIFIFGNIPCILAYGYWRDIKIGGRNIFDTFDFVSGNIFFVLTALGASIFVGYVLGSESIKELKNGAKLPESVIRIWFAYIKYIIPIIIVAIFISGFFISF